MVKFKEQSHSKEKILQAKKARNAKIITVVISLIFLLSTFVYFVDRDTTQNYNTYKVGNVTFDVAKDSNDQTYLKIRTQNAYNGATFLYVPETDYVSYFKPSDKEIVSTLSRANFIYLAIDPSLINSTNTDSIQIQDLSRLQLSAFFQKSKKLTFNSYESEFNNETVFGCNQATKDAPVISFRYEESTDKQGIVIDNTNSNCVKIVANNENTIKLIDYLKFAIATTN